MSAAGGRLFEALKTGERPSLADLMTTLADALPLLHELEATEQDPVWHGEGNVRIHTENVLGELYSSLDALGLSSENRAALILATALHDIAKPISTRREQMEGVERIVAPRHADKGRSYLGKRLPALGLTGARLDTILSLVGHHHDPLRLSRRNQSAGAYLRLARHACPRLLFALEQADFRGRVCTDLEAQLEALDFFFLRCEEEQVVASPPRHLLWAEPLDAAFDSESPEMRAVARAQSVLEAEAGVINTVEEAIARSHRYLKPFPILYVMCGVAGSGKSTWIETELEGAEVIALDDIRLELFGSRRDRKHEGQVVQEAKLRLKRALAAKRLVVWDSTGLMRERRAAIVRLAYDYGALVRLMTFNVTLPTLLERNTRRVASLPPHVVQQQFERFEIPYAHEAHEVSLRSEGEAEHSTMGYSRLD